MMTNPKIVPEAAPPQEPQDYPRFTQSMQETLAGIRRFRNELDLLRNV